jgi:hypothetical protein
MAGVLRACMCAVGHESDITGATSAAAAKALIADVQLLLPGACRVPAGYATVHSNGSLCYHEGSNLAGV